MTHPPLIDHIGWDLWQATQGWKQDFDAAMTARGYAWISDARGSLFRHIGQSGVEQTALPGKLGISKQAVQQLLDTLQSDGIITRKPSPKDARKKRIMLTEAGLKALDAGNAAKKELEARYTKAIGAEQMHALQTALRALIAVQKQP